MTKKLIFTLFTIVSAVSFAQMDDYEIETVEKNISREQDSDIAQDDYFKGNNEASDTTSSPQINIYNANSNANKHGQKTKQDSSVDAVSTSSSSGDEYIMRANEIRSNRKNMEVGTEQKMIEKIEWSRIEDEKDRADRLFGNRLEKRKQHDDHRDEYKQEKVVVIQQAPVQQEVVVEKETPSQFWGSETYISPMAGSASYNSADNVRGDMSLGVALGTRMESGVSVEGDFIYSSYEMDDYNVISMNGQPGLKDVNQYNFVLGVKYNFDLGGRISPFIGAFGGYTFRDYQEKRVGDGSADSNAFDAGLGAGLDIKVAQNFSIGAEYRIMRNITYDRSDEGNNQVQQQQVQQNFPQQTAGKNLTPLEEIGYQMFLVNGKFTF